MKGLDAVIFDLDGTLIDSASDIAAAVNACLADSGWPAQDTGFVGRFIGYGPRRLLSDLFAEIGHPTDAGSIERAHRSYIEHYRAAPAERTLIFPHVREDIEALARAGIALGVCTNKPQEMTVRVLEALGLSGHFEAVVGADVLPVCKPDPRHLWEVARRMGPEKRHWVYVGDTCVDQMTAQNAGVRFFSVPWGGGADLEVRPSQRLNRLSELLLVDAESDEVRL